MDTKKDFVYSEALSERLYCFVAIQDVSLFLIGQLALCSCLSVYSFQFMSHLKVTTICGVMMNACPYHGQAFVFIVLEAKTLKIYCHDNSSVFL